jgi:hypothetical protein
MPRKKYVVKLEKAEREEIEKFIKSTSKKNTPQCKIHARILLYLDENGEDRLTPEQTAQKCKLHKDNVYKIRKQFCTEGIERVHNRKKRETPPIQPKVTGEVEAHIIAIACSTAPEGKKAWTLQMIADKVVLDGAVDSLGKDSVRRVLKKRNISHT